MIFPFWVLSDKDCLFFFLQGVNSVIQSTPGPPIVAQTVTQPPLPVFRQPAGVHISHYPSNYIPYNPYFSPFYIPPHSVHPYLSNAAFPHQHPIAPIYSPMAAAAPIKYPVSQFKTGTNSTHTPHVGLPTGYGPYNSNLTGYSPNSAPNTVNSASNDDLAASQYKDNMYLSVQQVVITLHLLCFMHFLFCCDFQCLLLYIEVIELLSGAPGLYLAQCT